MNAPFIPDCVPGNYLLDEIYLQDLMFVLMEGLINKDLFTFFYPFALDELAKYMFVYTETYPRFENYFAKRQFDDLRCFEV